MSTVKVVIRPEPWEDLTSETLHQQQPNSHTKLLTSLQQPHLSHIILTIGLGVDCAVPEPLNTLQEVCEHRGHGQKLGLKSAKVKRIYFSFSFLWKFAN